MPIVGLLSLSALKTRSFSSLKATLMSQNAVQNAVRQGSQSATETVATDPDARCFPQHAPSVAKAPKFLFSLAGISQFTAAIATEKSAQVDKWGLNPKSRPGWATSPEVTRAIMNCVIRSITT